MVGTIADSIHHAPFVDDDPLLRRYGSNGTLFY